MKTKSQKYHCTSIALLCGALIGSAALPTPAAAQNERTASQASGTAKGQTSRSSMQPNQVRVTRATDFIGSDVMGTDGRKAGDIVDYYFDLGASPHLAYIVIMTGGFLDLGGDRRAVPASAVSLSGDTPRINIASDRFRDLPVLPENSDRFMANAENRQRISEAFSQAGGSRTTAGTQAPSNSDPNANQAGAPTGRMSTNQADQRLVSFSSLRNADAYGRQDARIGSFVDAWINVSNNRAPYVEVTQGFQPFRSHLERRFAIPTAKVEQKRESDNYNVAVTAEELNQAKSISETEGVTLLEQDRDGATVLRVNLAQN